MVTEAEIKTALARLVTHFVAVVSRIALPGRTEAFDEWKDAFALARKYPENQRAIDYAAATLRKTIE